ncbi:MAG: fumarylacetoacetate hydrolase family protein [Arenicellales bacterium]|nr:fumarylacetoacetate hydrolase family protein [Arenicellales bacterium]MDC1072260.1 fumarylacetoacetate hydrolase family protein [Gammaproteobacteria bacterium]
MRLLRFGKKGEERPGLLDPDGKIRDLGGVIDDLGPGTVDPKTIDFLKALDPGSLPLVDEGVRIGSCISHPGKFVCIGLNYHDHAEETGIPPPSEPVVFMKAVSSIGGPHDDISLIRGSTKSDWEVELGIVIGGYAKYISIDEAEAFVAGFCLINDLSEREWQLERGGNWSKGKSGDGYGPVGPWLVTKEDVIDPQNLEMWLDVNGERMQRGTTADMIFPVTEIVAYLSHCMSLNPGDIIATGTPAGVGLGRSPPRFLCDNDELRLGITGLGEQSYRILKDDI